MTSLSNTRMISSTQGVSVLIAYPIREPFIFWEALNAPGSGITSIGTRRFPDGNKRLAMLGDAVLKSALLQDWYVGSQARGSFPFMQQAPPEYLTPFGTY